jgi:hypothetical protein
VRKIVFDKDDDGLITLSVDGVLRYSINERWIRDDHDNFSALVKLLLVTGTTHLEGGVDEKAEAEH